MPRPQDVRTQVERLTADLIELSLCNDQNFPSMIRTADGCTEVSFSSRCDISVSLKNLPYREVYEELGRAHMYNLRLLDGALVQMMYRFRGDIIEAHRLAFYPSPFLEEFQNNPEIYLDDDIYAEVVQRSIVPFPLRFEFDCRDEVFREVDHPRSHLTLGQYQNCRIPVSAPLTPYHFISFIMRSFYHTAYLRVCDRISAHNEAFVETIESEETNLLHVRVPAALQ